MKRYIKPSTSSVECNISIVFNYKLVDMRDMDVAASNAIDKLDLSSLNVPIINSPVGITINTNSEAWRKFIEAVNMIDKLCEVRGITIVGESESNKEDSESVCRSVLMNLVKDVRGVHYSIKQENVLRVAGHKETREARRNRGRKQQEAAESPEARKLNDGNPLVVGKFQSIVVRATASDPSMAEIEDKELSSHKDVVLCVDKIFDDWGFPKEIPSEF